jgi:hypothetical protein
VRLCLRLSSLSAAQRTVSNKLRSRRLDRLPADPVSTLANMLFPFTCRVEIPALKKVRAGIFSIQLVYIASLRKCELSVYQEIEKRQQIARMHGRGHLASKIRVKHRRDARCESVHATCRSVTYGGANHTWAIPSMDREECEAILAQHKAGTIRLILSCMGELSTLSDTDVNRFHCSASRRRARFGFR